MTENEIKLMDIIREHSSREEALITAIEIILLYLEQPESFEEPISAYLREYV